MKWVDVNPLLKINRIITFSCIQMLFTVFVLCILIKPNNIQKTSLQSYKTSYQNLQDNVLLNLSVALKMKL